MLAFQPTLPSRMTRESGRRRGALALSAGLRKWLGFGGNERQQDKWKQAVTEVNGPGLTDEEKLEAARVRRRALVAQDPTYRARLQKRGTIPIEVGPVIVNRFRAARTVHGSEDTFCMRLLDHKETTDSLGQARCAHCCGVTNKFVSHARTLGFLLILLGAGHRSIRQ